MSKHTPGPWYAVEHTKGVIITGQGKQIADVYDHRKTRFANARLIAAAPEMYGALKATRKALAMQVYETGQPGTWATMLDDRLAEILAKIEA